MAKENKKCETERAQKGNSSDTLLSIYVLRVLKKYSTRESALTVQQVLKYLQNDYSLGLNETEEARRKKIRRYLDTLSESYGNGCIVKEEGVKKDGYKWYYDVSKDSLAYEDGQVHETLSDIELELIIDLISATKILNADSTMGMIDKLLKKMSLSDEEREEKLRTVKKENWTKNPNDYLLEIKECIQEYIDAAVCISFIYEDNDLVVATPCGWVYSDGKCFLKAKVGCHYREFLLDKIHDVNKEDGCTDEEYDYNFDENLSNNTSLESLFSNIPFIKNAIKEKRGIKFFYRSYSLKNNRVVLEDDIKNVLPHSLVFNDGKYYLIGIDQDAINTNKIGYFRVDLIADLSYLDAKISLSEWHKQVFETIQRAREVEKHPLMVSGQEIEARFLVKESALDRVIDDFGTSPKFLGTKERVIASNYELEHGNTSYEDLPKEKMVKFAVRTTREEAFRWALANADVVELLHPQDVRDGLARIADPIYQIYTQTASDKVRENIDYVLKNGIFKIDHSVDEDTAYETYKELCKRGKLVAVKSIGIKVETLGKPIDYMGDFINATSLYISAPESIDLSWASRLVNLTKIELLHLEIDDVSWMRQMPKLRRVYMDESTISDLSVLSEHKEIDWLNISDTQISDISFIENFSKLTYLNIVGCHIDDYSPLLTTKSRITCLEIGEKELQEIGEDNIQKRHIGISIIPRKNTPFWRFLI